MPPHHLARTLFGCSARLLLPPVFIVKKDDWCLVVARAAGLQVGQEVEPEEVAESHVEGAQVRCHVHKVKGG